MDDNESKTPGEDIFVSIAGDEDTWLPEVRLGFPLTSDEDIEPILAMMAMSPETAYKVGAALLHAATVSAALYADLIDKDIEARREIFTLEQELLTRPDPNLN
jgi:hypothetical protein